jgi:hypothetical protein
VEILVAHSESSVSSFSSALFNKARSLFEVDLIGGSNLPLGNPNVKLEDRLNLRDKVLSISLSKELSHHAKDLISFKGNSRGLFCFKSLVSFHIVHSFREGVVDAFRDGGIFKVNDFRPIVSNSFRGKVCKIEAVSLSSLEPVLGDKTSSSLKQTASLSACLATEVRYKRNDIFRPQSINDFFSHDSFSHSSSSDWSDSVDSNVSLLSLLCECLSEPVKSKLCSGVVSLAEGSVDARA